VSSFAPAHRAASVPPQPSESISAVGLALLWRDPVVARYQGNGLSSGMRQLAVLWALLAVKGQSRETEDAKAVLRRSCITYHVATSALGRGQQRMTIFLRVAGKQCPAISNTSMHPRRDLQALHNRLKRAWTRKKTAPTVAEIAV